VALFVLSSHPYRLASLPVDSVESVPQSRERLFGFILSRWQTLDTPRKCHLTQYLHKFARASSATFSYYSCSTAGSVITRTCISQTPTPRTTIQLSTYAHTLSATVSRSPIPTRSNPFRYSNFPKPVLALDCSILVNSVKPGLSYELLSSVYLQISRTILS
jgi:hypothetical protein